MLKFYGYDKCSTCRNAKKHLAASGVAFKDIDITTTPPPKTVLKAILKAGQYQLANLFNRSGQVYREMNMKEKLKTMSEADAIDLLSRHGKLVKRPIVTDGTRHTVGYDPDVFDKCWG